MSSLTDVSVILPSLDPDEKLIAVVNGLLEYGFQDIILINDGSKQENLHYFEEAALHSQVTLLHHECNKGKGAALKTGFSYFLENRPNAKGVVTVDGDNQHHPADTKACSQYMLETGHAVLGVRDFSQPDVPMRSRKGNRITSAVFKIFVGMTISDTQTGLRALPRDAVQALLQVAGDRFEYETNMLLAFKDLQIPFDEVKIRTVYIEENRSSHFRVVRDSWRIYKLILGHFFRYTLSSLVSSVVEEIIYALSTWLLVGLMSGALLTLVSSVTARVLSSVLNFSMNKVLVFKSKGNTRQAIVRYISLAVPQLVAQIALTELVYFLFRITAEQTLLRSVVYAIVMIILFVFSFVIQQRWVFADNRKKKN